MDIFEAVKEQVTAREAAERYGIQVSRYGMAVCPFHQDKNPSLKLDRRFHCFGCGADGDVINLVARLFGLKNGEAVKKIAEDFGVLYTRSRASPVEQYTARQTRQRKQAQQNRFSNAGRKFFQIFCDYRQMLGEWEERYAPANPDDWDHIDPRFEEALQNKSRIDYILDSFICGSPKGQEEAGRGNDGPGIPGRSR